MSSKKQTDLWTHCQTCYYSPLCGSSPQKRKNYLQDERLRKIGHNKEMVLETKKSIFGCDKMRQLLQNAIFITKYDSAIVPILFISITIEIKLYFGEEFGYLERIETATNYCYH